MSLSPPSNNLWTIVRDGVIPWRHAVPDFIWTNKAGADWWIDCHIRGIPELDLLPNPNYNARPVPLPWTGT